MPPKRGLTNKQYNALLKAAKSKAPRQRRNRGFRQQQPQMMSKLHQHAMMLHNPATGSIASVYDGEEGNCNRFTLDLSTPLTLGNTAAYYIFHPNTGWAASGALLDSSVAFTPGFATSASVTPGYSFMNASARKVRALAAGVRFSTPGLTFSTLAGEVSVGCISADVLTTSSTSITVDDLFRYAAARAPIVKGVQEVKWFPGSLDSKYSTFVTSSLAGTGTDLNDTNVVFVVFRGVPTGTSLSFKVDWVTEWVGRATSGFTPSHKVNAGHNHNAVVKALHDRKPGWFHQLTGEAEAGAAALGIGGLATKFFSGSKSFASRTLPVVEDLAEGMTLIAL